MGCRLITGKRMSEITIKIAGLSCGGCVGSVTRVLQALPGVEQVTVSLEAGEARVQYDVARVSVPALLQVVDDAGFSASSA